MKETLFFWNIFSIFGPFCARKSIYMYMICCIMIRSVLKKA